MQLTLENFNDWLQRYFTAWDPNELELLDGLFAEDSVYYYGPFKPSMGKKRIIRFDAKGQCVEHKEWFVRREVP